MEEGNDLRTTAATNMNDTSSRNKCLLARFFYFCYYKVKSKFASCIGNPSPFTSSSVLQFKQLSKVARHLDNQLCAGWLPRGYAARDAFQGRYT